MSATSTKFCQLIVARSVLGPRVPERLEDARFRFECGHHLIQRRGFDRGRVERCLNLGVGLSEGVLVHVSNGVARRFRQFDQLLAHLGLPGALADDINSVSRLAELLLHRAAVDAVDHRPQQGVAGQDEQGRDQRLADQVGAGAGVDGG